MKKFAQAGAATLSTVLLIVAVAKAQGCQRPEPTPTVVPVVATPGPSPAHDAEHDHGPPDMGPAAPAEPHPQLLPATKSGLFVPPSTNGADERRFMGATKSAGFIEPQGIGLTGIGELGKIETPDAGDADGGKP